MRRSCCGCGWVEEKSNYRKRVIGWRKKTEIAQRGEFSGREDGAELRKKSAQVQGRGKTPYLCQSQPHTLHAPVQE